MRIVVDAFGGDNAPLEILKGCELAVKEADIEIVLSGNEADIISCAKDNNISLDKMSILQADSVISMEDHPDVVIRGKKDSSMAVGLKSVAQGEGDAFVSAGSTGALVVGATFIVKRIKGAKRAALAPILPTDDGNGVMLIDSGANVECRPEMLLQFGIMGYYYMKGMGVENPRVGLLNVGTEDTKGGELQLQAFKLLSESEVNFVGNVEARDVLNGVCDVLVCDGFSGNILLKTCEGTVAVLMNNLRPVFKKNLLTMLCYSILKPGLKGFKAKLDYNEHGGAPLMGVTKPVIKAHGSSKATAFKNAILQAVRFADSGAIDKIANDISTKKEVTADE